jgi:hypothetical protein
MPFCFPLRTNFWPEEQPELAVMPARLGMRMQGGRTGGNSHYVAAVIAICRSSGVGLSFLSNMLIVFLSGRVLSLVTRTCLVLFVTRTSACCLFKTCFSEQNKLTNDGFFASIIGEIRGLCGGESSSSPGLQICGETDNNRKKIYRVRVTG